MSGSPPSDAGQAWFWTEVWQAGEREVDADLAAGRVERFDSGDELLARLREIAGLTTEG